MKTVFKLFFYFALIINSAVYAEVITDGSLGSPTTLSGQMDIPQNLGTTAGNNLFHSFSRFNVNTGESVTFTGDNALQNIISRVTGGQVSVIDGLLQSTIGNANFYFINPAGVMFGANAQIDVPAAFYVSTADTLRFGDGSQFSASNPTASLLSVAEPTGFGFLNNQGGNITVQDSVLEFKQASTATLSAHNVAINNGWLFNAGQLKVYATGNTVTEIPVNAAVPQTLTGRVELHAGSSLDVSNDTGGKIDIQGGDIIVDGGSSLSADTLGSGNAGGVSIKANTLSLLNGGRIGSDSWDTGNAGDIDIDAGTILVDGLGGKQFTVISSNSNNDVIANAGNAGNINIKANNLSVLNGGQISNDSWGSGNAGDLKIDAGTILVDGQGGKQFTAISSNSNNDVIANAGSAGNVNIKANNVSVVNGGQISIDSWGSGNAGNVVINAANILVDGQGNGAWISSNSNNELIANAGKAGSVSITGGSVSVLNRGQISSDAWGTGNAGAINIQAGEILVDGQGNNQFTGIASNTNNEVLANAGNAGNVSITANKLKVSDKGQIVSDTWGSGQAGNIVINAANISVDGKGNNALISSSSRNKVLGNAGSAGVVNLKADSLNVSNKGQITTLTSGTGNAGNIIIDSNNTVIGNGAIHSDTESGSTGNAGNVIITGNSLTVTNNGQISSDTGSSGNAGNIVIDAGNLSVDGNSALISSSSKNQLLANAGNAGTVNLKANNLGVSNGGQITTFTSGTGNAGNINISGNNTLINNAKIFSDANVGSTGNAGTISIANSNAITAQNGASISSSTSGAGSAGHISVTAPVIILDNASISAEASAQSQGQTGNVTVAAAKAIYLANHGKISLKNDANIANTAKIIPTSITVSAPDINLKDSEITTAATGNVDAGDININFSHWLTMDPSFITTTANTGNGGDITIRGGELIYLQNSGFLTSVSGANSNGGNINVSADQLVMETGVIQANAVGGSGGNINLNLKALIPSQNRLIIGGRKLAWQPFIPGLNVIQAASENGVNGTVNVTSPQFDISASVSGLDSAQLVIPDIDRNLCQSSAMLASTLARGGQGGIPADESQYSFIPPAATQAQPNLNAVATSTRSSLSKESFPCASLQP